jgi:hypothetical protein
MPFRQHPRITDTRDLRATFRSTGDSGSAHRVLNLSEGGMLITGTELGLENGELATFELAARNFSAAGTANVVHQTRQATGLRFLGLHGQDDRELQGLIAAASHTLAHEVPGEYLG